MIVSIIIPVYNVEKYFKRCIESIMDQSYTQIEIILVDDGSLDSSGALCDVYALKDKRIKVIHKENGGLSSARNVGIDNATGDLICFVDSDDYVSCDYIERMVNMLLENKADVSILQMKLVPEDCNVEFCSQEKEKVLSLDTQDGIEASLYQKLFTCCAPSKLYKRSVIGSVRFPEGKISEDLATCHLFFNNADKIVYSSYFGYYYRQHNKSIMHNFSAKRLDALEWCNSIENFCLNNFPMILNAAYCRTFNVCIHLLLDLPKTDDNYDLYSHELWDNIKRTRGYVLLDIKARKREKIAALLSFGGENILRFVWNSKFAIRKG